MTGTTPTDPTAAPGAVAPTATPAQQHADLPSNVVALDTARAEGEAKAIAYVQEMNNLCALAGVPEKAAQFIAAKTSVTDASKALLAARAAESDATAIVTTPAAGAQGGKRGAVTALKPIAEVYAKRTKEELGA